MFPIPWNFPFRKKDGSMSTISAEMGGSIPPATADKLGGIKVGSGLTVTSDGTLSGVNELPSHTISESGKVLTVGVDGSLEWDESGAGGGDEIILDYFEGFTASGTHEYTRQITITEPGNYNMLIGGFATNATVKINDVVQANAYDDSGSYIHFYHESSKSLAANDVIDITLSSSGRTLFTAYIIKLANET